MKRQIGKLKIFGMGAVILVAVIVGVILIQPYIVAQAIAADKGRIVVDSQIPDYNNLEIAAATAKPANTPAVQDKNTTEAVETPAPAPSLTSDEIVDQGKAVSVAKEAFKKTYGIDIDNEKVKKDYVLVIYKVPKPEENSSGNKDIGYYEGGSCTTELLPKDFWGIQLQPKDGEKQMGISNIPFRIYIANIAVKDHQILALGYFECNSPFDGNYTLTDSQRVDIAEKFAASIGLIIVKNDKKMPNMPVDSFDFGSKGNGVNGERVFSTTIVRVSLKDGTALEVSIDELTGKVTYYRHVNYRVPRDDRGVC